MKVYAMNGKIDYSKTTEENMLALDFLLETSNLEFGDNFSFDKKSYSFCSYNHETEVAIVEEFELKEMNDYDYRDTDEITCPYCGYKDQDSWDTADENDDAECPICSGVFEHYREVTISYYSEKVKAPSIKEIKK